MNIGMLSSNAWATPPKAYGPWQQATSDLTEELVRLGVNVTLFATGGSHTNGTLISVTAKGYEEDPSQNAKVIESLHISNFFEHADEFDILHNQFDYLPLTYLYGTQKPMVTTIHGFSSPSILPVYKKYDDRVHYVSISDANRSDQLSYARTIYNGISVDQYQVTPKEQKKDHLLFFGRFHRDKAVVESITVAKRANAKLHLAGLVHDKKYYTEQVLPMVDGTQIQTVGLVGREDKSRVLGEAKGLLHMLEFEEPFGLSLVEAMACGTPVIAMRKGSIPEIVEEGVNGFIVDSIDEAVEKIPLLDTIDPQACRASVEKKFSARRMAEQYKSLYEDILAGRV